MKYTLLLWSLILVIPIFSCNSRIKNKKDQNTVVPKQEKSVLKKTDECTFSVEEDLKDLNIKDAKVELIGLFENIKGNGEHNYGYALSLWQWNDQLVGFLNCYKGGLEPNRTGPLFKGAVKNDSVTFEVWTKQNKGFANWKESEVRIFSFTGTKKDQVLVGQLSVRGCSNATLQKKEGEQITLGKSDMWELKSFKNFTEWETHYGYELDYGD